MQTYIAPLCSAFFVSVQFLDLPVGKEILGYRFLLTDDVHLVKPIDLFDDSLHKIDILKLLLAWVSSPK